MVPAFIYQVVHKVIHQTNPHKALEPWKSAKQTHRVKLNAKIKLPIDWYIDESPDVRPWSTTCNNEICIFFSVQVVAINAESSRVLGKTQNYWYFRLYYPFGLTLTLDVYLWKSVLGLTKKPALPFSRQKNINILWLNDPQVLTGSQLFSSVIGLWCWHKYVIGVIGLRVSQQATSHCPPIH